MKELSTVRLPRARPLTLSGVSLVAVLLLAVLVAPFLAVPLVVVGGVFVFVTRRSGMKSAGHAARRDS